jgi:hypothetical protein
MNIVEVPYFTPEQGNLLVKLLIAHVLSDFVFQTKAMVQGKAWFSKCMLLHIGIVFLITLFLSLSVSLALGIAIFHWLIDSLKVKLLQKYRNKEYMLFVIDQVIHVLIILIAWCTFFNFFNKIRDVIVSFFNDPTVLLLLLAYLIVIWPVGFLLRFALQGLLTPGNNITIERGGKLIGQFERIIILTFVLLGQYEAIGFLITGKSIIRFAQRDENMKSEYVLVGTMMSYAFSILTGVLANWLIKLH